MMEWRNANLCRLSQLFRLYRLSITYIICDNLRKFAFYDSYTIYLRVFCEVSKQG